VKPLTAFLLLVLLDVLMLVPGAPLKDR